MKLVTPQGRPWTHAERDAEIVAKYKAGAECKALAAEYAVSISRVHQVLRKRLWIEAGRPRDPDGKPLISSKRREP